MVSQFFDKSSSKSTEQQRKKGPKAHQTAKPPRRPMTSYNIFFLLERERIISGSPERKYTAEDAHNIVALQQWKDIYYKRKHRKSHGIISFKDLSIVAAANWRRLDAASSQIFYDCAERERSRHAKELHSCRINQSLHLNIGQAFTPVNPAEEKSMNDASPVASQENAYCDHTLDISLHKLTGYAERMALLPSTVQCPDVGDTVSSSDIPLTSLDWNESLGTVGSWMREEDSHCHFSSSTNLAEMAGTDDLLDRNAIIEDNSCCTMESFNDLWAV
jgi:hypothetical protein